MENLRNLLISIGVDIGDLYNEDNPCTERIYLVLKNPTDITKVRRNFNAIRSVLGAPHLTFTDVVPGRPLTISFEYNNNATNGVYLKPLLASTTPVGELPIILGVDSYNNVLQFDLAKAPHLLIAGATGQGKSVCLHTIIQNLLRQDVEVIIIDPKNSELLEYKDMFGNSDEWQSACNCKPFGTDIIDANGGLKFLRRLMEVRNEAFSKIEVKNIEEYNEKCSKKMKRFVFICDEFADFSTSTEEEDRYIYEPLINGRVKKTIYTSRYGPEFVWQVEKLSSLARSAGIHLILATQRPTADIVEGNIKSNFPTRIAFRMVTYVDSKVILDKPAAELLKGHGDAIFMDGNGFRRFQCAINN